jgi:hypothetical protein
MKPYLHANISAKKFGGIAADYLDIHNFIDSSKACLPDYRHRAMLHNSFGCFIVEQMFGVTRTNSEGKVYSPRDVAEAHIIEDLGFIPTVEQYLGNMVAQPWMSGTRKTEKKDKSQFISFEGKVDHD